MSTDNLLSLKDDMVAFIEGHGLRRLPGYVTEDIPSILWESQNNPDAWKDIDYAAVHEYDFQEFLANPDLYDARMKQMREAADGKPFLATEICVNDPHYQEPSYRIAFAVAQLYHKNLTELDAVALMYCWLLLDVE